MNYEQLMENLLRLNVDFIDADGNKTVYNPMFMSLTTFKNDRIEIQQSNPNDMWIDWPKYNQI